MFFHLKKKKKAITELMYYDFTQLIRDGLMHWANKNQFTVNQ